MKDLDFDELLHKLKLRIENIPPNNMMTIIITPTLDVYEMNYRYERKKGKQGTNESDSMNNYRKLHCLREDEF